MSLELGHLRSALDAVTPEGIQAKVFQHSDDCVVGIVFHYQELSPLKRVRMSETVYENYDLYLRPGDTDAHRPLKVFFSDGGRDNHAVENSRTPPWRRHPLGPGWRWRPGCREVGEAAWRAFWRAGLKPRAGGLACPWGWRKGPPTVG